MLQRCTFSALLILGLLFSHSLSASALDRIQKLDNASYWLKSCDSQATSFREEKEMVPASTLKIFTAMEALRHWGPEHRFETDFYYEDNGTLWVKGYGDPYLTSEELRLMVEALKDFLPGEVERIGVDGSYYQTAIHIPGREKSHNPYDAPSSALAANFNTVFVRKSGATIESAENMTPLTGTAKALAEKLSDGKRRVSIPFQEHGVIHFGELLGKLLANKTLGVVRQPVPTTAELFYTHTNSRDLQTVIEAMLRYSNNFIANQLFLNLGAAKKGAPATLEKSQEVFGEQLELSGLLATIEEGSGLSRNNKITAQQLVKALGDFNEWKSLLPKHGTSVLAKTGTLKGVRTLAGFAKIRSQWQPFAIFVNEHAPHRLRYQVLKELIKRGERCADLTDMTITRLIPR